MKIHQQSKLAKATSNMIDVCRGIHESQDSHENRFFMATSHRPNGQTSLVMCALDDRAEEVSKILYNYLEQILDEDETT